MRTIAQKIEAKGITKGTERMLRIKFKNERFSLMPDISQISDLEKLNQIIDLIEKSKSIDDIEKVIH